MPSSNTSPILQALEQGSETSAASAAGGAPAGHFCAEGRLALDALGVEVWGVGQLGYPIAPERASALHATSTPAPYGRRQETLLDTEVRDTGEIDTQALQLHWSDGALAALQTEVAHALGLPEVRAHPHKLLVYGPGQFFKPHQDTEKQPGMVATLVLVLPSAHIGGKLCIWHGEESASFASQHLQTNALRWFAFYADCKHEVREVGEGWRIVLTFDLVVPQRAAAASPPPPAALLAALRARFYPAEGPTLRPWALLLEHEYTEHGLRWHLLKGEDRPRGAALRSAAQALGLSCHLALTEIHQLWSATVEYRDRRGGRESVEPDELIEEECALNFWVDADNKPQPCPALPMAMADCASFTDTDESFLVDEEYQGYMGNYGETLDYWYRRAALVLQTPLAREAARFAADFDGALTDALDLARTGQTAMLAQRLQAAARTLQDRARSQGRTLLGRYAELACALADAAQAHTLLSKFDWRGFEPQDAEALARLQGRWGSTWMQSLLPAWAQPGLQEYRNPWSSAKEHTLPWPQPLAPFIHACQNAALAPSVVDAMLTHCGNAVDACDAACASQTPAQRMASQTPRMKALCELVEALQRSPQAQRALGERLRSVQTRATLYPLRGLGPLVQRFPRQRPEMAALRDAVVDALRRALAQPESGADDHRLNDIEWTCRCADCKPVIDWANSRGAEALTLALAEMRRTHIQSQLGAAGAPVRTEIVKKGSPYKLVLHKPTDLHARRVAQRQAWREDLAWLEQNTP
ncbi:MAG: 2OG-Fe(II) oxygenase [Rhodoferax sp.]